MRAARIVYDGTALRVHDPEGGDEVRRFGDTDRERLERLATRYERAASRRGESELLAIGKELGAWLDDDRGWWTRIVDSAVPPLGLEIEVPRRREDSGARALLMAPWEVLADQAGFLATSMEVMLSPWRRLGGRSRAPEVAPTTALSVLFMAAAPEGARALDYEQEERAILEATRDLRLDLFVEETGTASELGQQLVRISTPEAPVQVVHISCHGHSRPSPRLQLEDLQGMAAPTDAAALIKAASKLREVSLLFVSACLTAQEGSQEVTSLAGALVKQGLRASLGWAGSVHDREATVFAAALYQKLAEGAPLEEAVAAARVVLYEERNPQGRPGEHWHSARLILGPQGGGVLASAGAPRRRARGIAKAYLGRERTVEVAGPDRFVGRRPQIQEIIRTLRRREQAGVLIYAVGFQGKSSLAARVVDRMPSHELALVFEHYDALTVFDQLDTSVRDRQAATQWRDAWRSKVGENGRLLEDALRELLEGACRGGIDYRPVLLVIDDLERILVEMPGGIHRVDEQHVEVIEAVVAAFDKAQTESVLLITSRFRFSLTDVHGTQLVPDRVFELPLPGMSEHEATKQALTAGRLEQRDGEGAALTAAMLSEAVDAAMGNPGVLAVLTTLAAQNPERYAEALEQMQRLRSTGELPSDEELQRRFRQIATDGLLGLLSDGEKALMRASRLFEQPFPAQFAPALAEMVAAGPEAPLRLRSLGVWEVHRELGGTGEALLLNGLVRAFSSAAEHGGTLSGDDEQMLAAAVLPGLLEVREGLSERAASGPALQLVRLAILACNGEVAARFGGAAILHVGATLGGRSASEFAEKVVGCIEASGREPPIMLLHHAASVKLNRSPAEADQANVWLGQAVRKLERDGSETMADTDEAALLLSYARQLKAQGQPGALPFFERASGLLHDPQYEREAAIVLGDIARIRVSKGEVDEALELHNEELIVYERLGDARSRAVTLGDIARIRVSKGEVDEALELHNERLAVFDKLGDARSRAVTLGDIARIRVSKGEVDEALELHNERLAVFDKLGDARSRAVTLGDIARIRVSKGEVDEALELHNEMLEVFDKLGDARSRAVTLGDIARIRVSKGEVDEALGLHNERLAVFDKLGDKDGRANTLWGIGTIALARGEGQAAYDALEESYQLLIELGRLDGIIYVGLDLGRLLAMDGHPRRARVLLERSRSGLVHLGRTDQATQVQSILDQLRDADDETT